MNKTEFKEALYKAYIFGQNYWRDADSDNPRQWPKSDITQDKFRAFVSEMAKSFEETIAASQDDGA